MTKTRLLLLAVAVPFLGALLVASPSGANAPAGHYTFPATGTVFDTRTGLTWQQHAPTALSTQGGAVAVCFNTQLPGTGWRLPTVKELLTLFDAAHGGGLDTAAFPSEPLGAYWSVTPAVNQPNFAWIVIFGPGNTPNATEDVTITHLVRCVR